MKSRAHLVTSFALVGLGMCSGCGLVPFPAFRTIPDPIRQVQVVKEDTEQPIADAEVVMHAERFKNWMRSFHPHCSAGFTPAGDTSVVVPLRQLTAGRFTPESRKVRRYIRPWGLGPLGTTIHEDYALTVSVRAEGYMALTATYSPAGDMNPSPEIARAEAAVSFPKFGTDGTLTVFLRAKNAEPDGPANGSQPIRSETNSTSSAAGSRLWPLCSEAAFYESPR